MSKPNIFNLFKKSNRQGVNLLTGNITVTTGTIDLSDSIYNYDFLIVTTGGIGNGTYNSSVVMPWAGSFRLNTNYDFNFNVESGYISGYFASETQIIVETNTPNLQIRQVYGVKIS